MLRIRFLGGACALACCSVVPSFAIAQSGKAPASTRPDEIIVTGVKSDGDFGGKSGIPLDRVPQSVQIISADELIERGVTSIADALRGVPSANLGNSRVARYQSFSVVIRGFLADQMRNGIRQRYFEDVDASALSNIERIEVLKGPSAVLYGQSAVGGIISIITKQPTDDFAASVALTGGSFDQRVATFDIGGPLSDTLGVRLTGEIERSGTFIDFQDIDRENFGLALQWRPTPRISANLSAEYVARRTLSNPGLPIIGTLIDNGSAPIPVNRFLAEPAFGELKANAPLVQAWVSFDLGGGWSITPRVQYSQFNTPFTQIRVLGVEAADPTRVRRNGRIGSEDDDYTITQLDLSGGFKTGPIGHTLLVGYEYDRERSTFVQSNFASVPSLDALNPVYLSAAERPALNFAFNFAGNLDGHAIYAQDQIAVTDRLGLILGFRHAWLRNTGFFSTDPTTFGDPDNERTEQTSFQAGGTYRLDGGFSLFGGYNSGYDVENSFGGAPTITGDRLSPETSQQYEAGLRYTSASARLSASAFEITRRDVAGDDPDNPGFSRNFGSLRVRGVELEGWAQPAEGLTLVAGYAFLADAITRSDDPAEVGGRIRDVSRHSATFGGVYTLPGLPVDLRANGRYQGERATFNASNVLLPEVVLVDLGVSARIHQVRLDLTANNVFDRRYFTASNANTVFPGDPRTVSLRVTANF